MKTGILYVMCGIPGSGKSTWVREEVKKKKHAVVVSRDEIRFSMLKDGEDYFARENEVYEEFVNQINKYLELGYEVYADATHINKPARKKLLNKIKGEHSIVAFVMETPSSVCIQRNENREGRRFVPRSVIRRMDNQFEYPTFDEGFRAIGSIEWDWREND